MEQGSFKVSAEVLQKNAMKASIRDLNAEFQKMGGKVIHKASKHGSVYLLSHPNDEYLEQFRIRLFKELGLIEEKDVPKELKGPESQAPRYGDSHRLRKGWNVRSEKEVKEGRFDDPNRVNPWKGPGPQKDQEGGPSPIEPGAPEQWKERSEPPYRRFPDRRGPRVQREDRAPRPGHEDEEEGPPRDRAPDEDDEDEEVNYRTYEERWGNVEGLLSIVEEALENGAVDDGEIIRFAYGKELPEPVIKKLKKQLWDNRCRGPREKCPYGKKKFKFEDMMRAHYGKEEGAANIDSPLTRFLDKWVENVEKMFGPYRDKEVEVIGKISAFKPVYRKGYEHVKVLVYDLRIKAKDDPDHRDARKVWIRVELKDYPRLTQGKTLRIDDVIRFTGKCVLDPYFHDHWVVNIGSIDVVKEGQGEAISLVV